MVALEDVLSAFDDWVTFFDEPPRPHYDVAALKTYAPACDGEPTGGADEVFSGT